jgi:RNA polymerase sigma-70 factor (ECF subfamily)
VYNILYDKNEVLDVSQEVFLRIYKNLDKYNPKYKFSTWAVKVSTNLCLDINRKKKLNTSSIEEIEFCLGDYETPEKEFLIKEEKINLQNIIDELPDKYRIPIILYHKNNMSYEDIKKVLGQPMSIVKNRLYRARKILKDKILKKRKEEVL